MKLVASAVVLCGILIGPVHAGSSGSPPEGVIAGKAVFRPFAWTAYQFDDNIFRAESATDDQINLFGLGAALIVPIRNSSFEIGGEAIKRQYQFTEFTRDTDYSVDVDLVLNFSSFDTLTIRNNYYSGFADVSRRDFDSGDAVFDGLPFEQFRTDIEVLRGVSNEKGYYFRASRSTLRFDEEAAANTAFFDYDGYDIGGEYRQPFSSYKWLVVYAGFRRFDHQLPSSNEVQRQEDSGTLQVGLRGVLGKGQPFLIRLGWGTFDYKFPADPDQDNTSFEGLTAVAQWGLRVGSRTGLDLRLDRRALPSNFNTSYVNTRFAAVLSRPILRNGALGVDLRVDSNTYNDPISNCSFDSVTGRPIAGDRNDRRYGARANFDWFFGDMLSYRMGLAFDNRNSTCEQFNFDSTVLTLGVSVGWF